MQECRFCKEVIKEGDPFCKNCGYDPKTDSINPEFKLIGAQSRPSKKSKKIAVNNARSISPGVKKFALIGLVILVFSIFYKNHFNINNVAAEVKHFCTMVSKGKFKFGQDKRSKKIEWVNVRTFQENGK